MLDGILMGMTNDPNVFYFERGQLPFMVPFIGLNQTKAKKPLAIPNVGLVLLRNLGDGWMRLEGKWRESSPKGRAFDPNGPNKYYGNFINWNVNRFATTNALSKLRLKVKEASESLTKGYFLPVYQGTVDAAGLVRPARTQVPALKVYFDRLLETL